MRSALPGGLRQAAADNSDQEKQSTNQGGHEMARLDVADQQVNTNGTTKACAARERNGLPETAARRGTPGAESHHNAGRNQTTTEAGSIVCNERDQRRIQRV